MILIFCAFGAEMQPLRARIADESLLGKDGLSGYYGRIGNTKVALVETGEEYGDREATVAHALDTLGDIELVVTTGVAGALREDLALGAVVLADRVMTRHPESFVAERTLEVPRGWLAAVSGALETAGIEYAQGATLTSRHAIVTAADKRQAHAESGAIAVDMESAVIAIEANNRGLPFVHLRTIMDTAAQEVFGADLADEDGRLRVMAAAKTLLTNPAKIVGAARLVRNLRMASNSMAVAIEAVARRLD